MNNPDISDDRTEEDRTVDAWAVLAIFTALVLGAVHFVSGWTFDLQL
jgi:hypothetical protein